MDGVMSFVFAPITELTTLNIEIFFLHDISLPSSFFHKRHFIFSSQLCEFQITWCKYDWFSFTRMSKKKIVSSNLKICNKFFKMQMCILYFLYLLQQKKSISVLTKIAFFSTIKKNLFYNYLLYKQKRKYK